MKYWKSDPKTLIWVGGIAIILGLALPFLMVIKFLPSTYFLNFLAYGFQLVGMITSTVGAFSIVKRRQDLKKVENNYREEQPSDETR